MRSFRESLDRMVYHATHVLSIKAKALYVIIILISLFLSFGILYRLYMIIIPLLMFIIVALEFVIIAIAGSLIDELREGITQMYLSAGISRLEYVVGWLLSSLVYPILSITLAVMVPAFIISPDTLVKDISMSMGPYTSPLMVPPLTLFILAIAIQLAEHISVSLAVGVYTRRKGLMWFMLFLFTIILPLVFSIVVSILLFLSTMYNPYSYQDRQLIESLIISVFSPFTGFMMFPYNHPRKDLFYPYIFLFPLIISVGVIVIFILYVKKSMEV